MEVKKAIKKVIALGAGATLVGTTIMGAMAASLADYPSPFVSDGKFDGMIVVGDQAKAEDVIGATDIAMSLQYSLKTTKTVSTGGSTSTVVIEGDSWKVETSSKKFEVGENFTSIQSSIGDGDLDALADGVLKAKNSATYEQELRFTEMFQLVYEEDTDNDKVSDFLAVDNNDNIMVYKLTFKTAAESDIDTSTSPEELEDFKDVSISLLGVEYTITDADYETDSITLTLMGGAVNDIMEEGETKTFTVEGKDYEVTLDYVSTNSCKFTINGEVSKSLADGETETVAGIDIGVRDIMENEAGEAAGGDKVEFYLGADKVVLEDTNATDTTYDGTMTVGDETMDEVTVGIRGSESSGDFLLEMIQLNYTVDDDYWLAKGEMLTDKVDEPQAFINWDVKYEGLTSAPSEMIEISASGDDKLVMKVTLADGEVDIPLAYSINATHQRLGDKNNALIIDRNLGLSKDQYFILTTGSGTIAAEGEKSYVMQYRGADSSTGDATATLKFKNLATGATVERSFNIGSSSGTITLGGEEFTIVNASNAAAGTDDFDINITDGGATSGQIVTKGEALITIADDETSTYYNSTAGAANTGNTINISITETDAGNLLESGTQTTITATINAGDADEIGLSAPSFSGSGVLVTDPDDSDIQTALTKYGALVTNTQISNSPDKIEIDWPSAQKVGQAFVTSGATTSAMTESESGDVTYDEVVKIDVGAAVLASEVAGEETSNNLILVGGPCANSAAAVIMGNPENCVEGFEAGKAKVKLYENAGNVAMLVAGATALDTRGASQFVAEYEKNSATFADATDEIALTVTSLSSITASIPTAETAEEAEE